jgi:hypothetical protein
MAIVLRFVLLRLMSDDMLGGLELEARSASSRTREAIIRNSLKMLAVDHSIRGLFYSVVAWGFLSEIVIEEYLEELDGLLPSRDGVEKSLWHSNQLGVPDGMKGVAPG